MLHKELGADCVAARWPVALEDGEATAVVTRHRGHPDENAGVWDQLCMEAPVGLALIDEDLRYLKVNERLAVLNGIPAEAHIGKRVSEVLPNIAPHLEPLLRRILETGEPVVDLELEGPEWDHGGSARHCIVNYKPFFHKHIRGVQCSVLEITGLVKTQQKLLEETKIFEQVHDAVIQTDLEGRVRGWNGGAHKLFGYEAAEILGESVAVLYFEEDRQDIGRLVFEPLQQKGQHELVLRNRRKNGEECWSTLFFSMPRQGASASECERA